MEVQAEIPGKVAIEVEADGDFEMHGEVELARLRWEVRCRLR